MEQAINHIKKTRSQVFHLKRCHSVSELRNGLWTVRKDQYLVRKVKCLTFRLLMSTIVDVPHR